MTTMDDNDITQRAFFRFDVKHGQRLRVREYPITAAYAFGRPTGPLAFSLHSREGFGKSLPDVRVIVLQLRRIQCEFGCS
jgi:hypothetical protein